MMRQIRLADVCSLSRFGVLVATFSKTVLYAVLEVMDGSINVAHNDWFTFIFLYVIPNNMWTVVPFVWIFFVFGPALLAQLSLAKEPRAARKAAPVVAAPKSPARSASRSPRRKKQE